VSVETVIAFEILSLNFVLAMFELINFEKIGRIFKFSLFFCLLATHSHSENAGNEDVFDFHV
jgi:hypothetical protein